MKILIFNWQDIKSPLGGGAEVHLHEIFKRIAAMGHKVTLFAYRFEGSTSEENIDGLNVIRRGSRSFYNYHVPFVYLNKYRFEDFDIVIDDINKIPFYTPLFVRKPLLAISHHFFGKSIFLEAGKISGSYVYLSEKMVNVVYKKTPFAVVSQSTLDEFIERGFSTKNFSIVPNAIEQEHFPMKIGEKYPKPLVVFFGRLKKYKSMDHLLLAFPKILEKIPEAELFMLGRGNFQPYLEKLASDLGISDKVKFFGYVSEEDKIKYLGLAHCVVNTSMKEGWGITNIETNACGTPIISANVPGLKDSVKDGSSGLLYEYGNIEQISDLIISVLENNDYRQKLSEGAVEWARTFSWDNSAKLMLKRCEEVIENKINNF